ncbi:MAG: type II 3-dehydroquinate dehydratase [Alphaproteobacteria bacterium]|nr:MAG: type II 3-dehydroquinate dehydratase [Alphaproteobacteria bacterium]TAE83828.1 MAG: type II 3-dehydroquinate dehydratase [Alphaproteobacteria bacterium]TAF14492.1 MAG: type II 3-dehydroquinate dehydratase [Alphaproteobacteria bacterium]TAF76064.1 MAG: type II 3-dehydroquinate dehydratase [Alphaproteobacteria bacterium]
MEYDILLINGPNLSMLGLRQPEIYGHTTLEAIEVQCGVRATAHNLTVECFQSNHEGELIDKLCDAYGAVRGIIINAGGFSHTSVALRDALTMHKVPIIEVHISNIHAREQFRSVSFISGVATGVICGLGPVGYIFAIDALANLIST